MIYIIIGVWWTFTLVIIYFVIGAGISAHGCWIYSKHHPPDNEKTNGLLEGDVEKNGCTILTYRTKQNRSMLKRRRYLEEEYKEQMLAFGGVPCKQFIRLAYQNLFLSAYLVLVYVYCTQI
ncbi:hypothetical protein DsansV1_C06g0059361 [Dioscorea sansibarensis]